MPETGPEKCTGGRVRANGPALKELRLKKPFTAEKLAEKAGVSPKTIYNLEKGECCYPTTLAMIAEALGLAAGIEPLVIDSSEATEIPISDIYRSVGLLFDGNPEALDHTEELFHIVATIQSHSDVFDPYTNSYYTVIYVTGISRSSSFIIHTKMQEQLVIHLLNAFATGQLSALVNLRGIIPPSDYKVDLRWLTALSRTSQEGERHLLLDFFPGAEIETSGILVTLHPVAEPAPQHSK